MKRNRCEEITSTVMLWKPAFMAARVVANIANSGKSIDVLHNNCMLSLLIRIASRRFY